jgi:hypothetical protein
MPPGYVQKIDDDKFPRYVIRDGVGQWWAGAERRWKSKPSEAVLFTTEVAAMEERNRCGLLGDPADTFRGVVIVSVHANRWTKEEIASHLKWHHEFHIEGYGDKEGLLLEILLDTLRKVEPDRQDTSADHDAHDEPKTRLDMKTHGLPETFWIVLKPSPVSTLEDICFPCTFSRLMNQVRGGLQEDEIVGIYADETEARQAAARLLGIHPVRPQDAVFVEIIVNVQVRPKHEGMTARDLAKAAVEAVRNAVHQTEKTGFTHSLQGQVSLGAGTVELKNQTVVVDTTS